MKEIEEYKKEVKRLIAAADTEGLLESLQDLYGGLFVQEAPEEGEEFQAFHSLVRENADAYQGLLEAAWELPLKEHSMLIKIAPALWKFTDGQEEKTLSFFQELFAYEEEDFGEGDPREDPNYDSPAFRMGDFLKARLFLWQATPEKYRSRLRESYENGIEPFLEHELPLIRLKAREAQARVIFFPPSQPNREPGPDLSGLGEQYIADVLELLEGVEDRLDNARWNEVLGRLEYIGPGAAAAIPILEDILNGILAREIEAVTPRGKNEIPRDFGRLLFKLGAPSIPEAIQKAAAETPQYFPYVKDWEKQARAAPSDSASPAPVVRKGAVKKKPGRKKAASPLADLNLKELKAEIPETPYEVFLECERRLAEDKTKDLAKVAEAAANQIHELLDVPEDRDDMVDAFMIFSQYFQVEIYIDDEADEGIIRAHEILDERTEAFEAE